MNQFSLCKIILRSPTMNRELEGSGGNNWNGNYSIKHASAPPAASLVSFLCHPCSLCRRQGMGELKSGLGWVLSDPVI